MDDEKPDFYNDAMTALLDEIANRSGTLGDGYTALKDKFHLSDEQAKEAVWYWTGL